VQQVHTFSKVTFRFAKLEYFSNFERISTF